jgi:hypothetical protein
VKPPPQSLVLVDPQPRVGAVGECSTPSVIGGRGPIISRLVSALPTNKSGPVPIAAQCSLVDGADFAVADSSGNLIGLNAALWVHRWLAATRTNRMPISRRYTPETTPGEICTIGMDFSYVIPPGVGIASGTLTAYFNTVENQPSDDFGTDTGGLGVPQPALVHGRTLYKQIQTLDTAFGNDYQMAWFATDTDGNVWPRIGLLLCSNTS